MKSAKDASLSGEIAEVLMIATILTNIKTSNLDIADSNSDMAASGFDRKNSVCTKAT
jgi:hypothetical protein